MSFELPNYKIITDIQSYSTITEKPNEKKKDKVSHNVYNDDIIDLNSPNFTDYQKMNFVLKQFDKPSEFCNLPLHKIQKDKIRLLIQTSYLYTNDFNFQIRILFLIRQFTKLRHNLNSIYLLIPAILAFKKHKNKQIVYNTFIDILHSQIIYSDCLKILKDEDIFNEVLETALNKEISIYNLDKINYCLIELYDSHRHSLNKSQSQWLIESLTSQLDRIMNKPILNQDLCDKLLPISHFFVHVSRNKQFQPFLAVKLDYLLNNYPSCLLDMITITDNLLSSYFFPITAQNLLFDLDVHRLFEHISRILLNNKKPKFEIFTKIVRIFEKFNGLAKQKVVNHNFVNQLILITRLHPQRKLISPAVFSFTTTTILSLFTNKTCLVAITTEGKECNVYVLDRRFLAIEFINEKKVKKEKFIKSDNDKNDWDFYELSAIKNFNFFMRKSVFSLERDLERNERSSEDFIELSLIFSGNNNPVRLLFKPSERIFSYINPLMRCLISLRSINN